MSTSVRGGSAPRRPTEARADDGERRRLLRRLQADARQALADIAGVGVESRRLLTVEAKRPLTPAELVRARALREEHIRLWYWLAHLRAEVGRLRWPRERHAFSGTASSGRDAGPLAGETATAQGAEEVHVDDAKLVLLIDDDRDLAPIVQEVLEEAGWRVSVQDGTAAETIRQAIDRLEPDCILLDGSGRGDYGQSWLDAAAIHERARPIPVIMFTADKPASDEATAGESDRSQAAGFAAVLPKPFDLDALVATVAGVLRRDGPV